MSELQLVGEPGADALLSTDPFALLAGMLLDAASLQRVRSTKKAQKTGRENSRKATM